MAFRPTEVRDTPKSADPRPPATDSLTKREPRLATPEELKIAIPLKEEPKVGPGDRILTTVLFGGTGIALMAGMTSELARLLALGLVVEGLGHVGLFLMGASLLMAARVGARRGMGEAMQLWLYVGVVLMLAVGIVEDAIAGQPLREWASIASTIVVVCGMLLAARWSTDAGAASHGDSAATEERP